ncbi:MAG: YfiR family protein [Magnetococcales bacterium]|nr:YfiR family protein [Magnetococcales bacterium]
MSAGPGVAHADHSVSELQVEVAYLYNFTKFVTYPDTAFKDKRDVFSICILGDDPFADLIKVLEKKNVREKRINIELHANHVNTSGCHILFISKSEIEKLPEIISDLRNKPVLIVGDTPGFCSQGGMINFIRVENTLRFEVNIQAAGRAGLRISSAMLQVAKIVE